MYLLAERKLRSLQISTWFDVLCGEKTQYHLKSKRQHFYIVPMRPTKTRESRRENRDHGFFPGLR